MARRMKCDRKLNLDQERIRTKNEAPFHLDNGGGGTHGRTPERQKMSDRNKRFLHCGAGSTLPSRSRKGLYNGDYDKWDEGKIHLGN